jgi:hypothetical protein
MIIRRVFAILGLGALLVVLGIVSTQVCIRAWLFHGVTARQCPDGDMVLTAEVETHGLRRGGEGVVRVQAHAHYTTDTSDRERSSRVSRFDPEVSLIGPDGAPVAWTAKEGWSSADGGRVRSYALPQVPDGDYRLVARVRSSLGEAEVEAAVPLYAPARVHVLTDRPLYQPGDRLKFRAVVLRARDLSPIESRPGRWTVIDPRGEVVLEEKAPTGDWGVVAGDLPLDGDAPSGGWTVRWSSGENQGERQVVVEPFRLPRFRVELSGSKPFYRAGDRPVVRGAVIYASGAPVADASLELRWDFGRWPPPTDWLEGALPEKARTDAAGRFELSLPPVPADIRGQVPVSLRVDATDAAGDRVGGATRLLFSRDAIAVSLMTELGGRLVEGFNNRVYLRATGADGRVLRDTELLVKRAWEPSDRGTRTRTDADGVASLQLDPGPPVTIEVPPPPYRRPKKIPPVVRDAARDLLTEAEPSLADQVALDGWASRVAPCGRFADGGEVGVQVVLRVDPSGAVVDTAGDDEPATRCAREALSGARLPASRHRLLVVGWTLRDADRPGLNAELEGEPIVLDELRAQIAGLALDARRCLPDDVSARPGPRVGLWRTEPGRREVRVDWVADQVGDVPTVSSAVAGCVERLLGQVTLSEPARTASLGRLRFGTAPSRREAESRPRATIRVGYELAVSASAGKEEIGDTKVFVEPGQVPPVRLRATPVLARAGDPVEVELLRGPQFRGELPEKLWLQHEGSSTEAKLDPATRKARWTLPADARGWYEVSWSGQRALIFVAPQADLKLALTPDRREYRPGDKAVIEVRTTIAGQGAPAAVGLFGVDESLGQLAPLPGADELDAVQPRVETPSPAFGSLDGQALAMGRVQGANAAAAVVLAVGAIPSPPELDRTVYTEARGAFDAVGPLTDRFYVALAELHAQVRDWEGKAPSGEQMHPPTMARLWKQALDACQKRGAAVTDVYGRRLRLHRLPGDLLALTDPRAVVVEGTRLPEDVEDWARWVREEQP